MLMPLWPKVFDQEEIKFLAFMVYWSGEHSDQWNSHPEHRQFEVMLGRVHNKIEHALVLMEENADA